MAFNLGTCMHSGSHTDMSERFNRACIESDIGANEGIISDFDILTCGGRDVSSIFNDDVLANLDLSMIAPENDSMPQRRTFTNLNVADDSGIWCNPVSFKDFREL